MNSQKSKIALLSDIHGNDLALKSVLDEIRAQNISTVLICGDFVGYYYNVENALNLLKTFNVVSCKGNHEVILECWNSADNNEKARLESKYGNSFRLISQNLSKYNSDWLEKLDHPVCLKLNNKRICLAHGAPWDINQYLYEDTIANYHDKFRDISKLYDVVMLGHSHYQFVKKLDKLIVINPGSVGQPRSGTFSKNTNCMARAHWATLELDDLKVDLFSTLYDCTELLEQIDYHDPYKVYIKNVLLRDES